MRSPVWTKQENEILKREWRGPQHVAHVAKFLPGRSISAILAHAYLIGVSAPPESEPCPVEIPCLLPDRAFDEDSPIGGAR